MEIYEYARMSKRQLDNEARSLGFKRVQKLGKLEHDKTKSFDKIPTKISRLKPIFQKRATEPIDTSSIENDKYFNIDRLSATNYALNEKITFDNLVLLFFTAHWKTI